MVAVSTSKRERGGGRRALDRACLTVMVLVISGCTALRPHGPPPAAPAAAPTPAPVVRRLPPAPLTGPLLYHLLAGEIALQRGRAEFALGQLMRAARETPDPRVAEAAARLAGYAHNDRLGLEAAQRWARLEPDSVSAREVAAVLAVRAGKPDVALAQMDHLLSLPAPAGARALLRVAGVLAGGSDRDAALAVFRRLAKRHPKEAAAHLAVARVAFQARRLPLAAAQSRRALALQPDWPPAALLLAEVRIRQGHADAALSGLKKVVAVHPDERELRLAYARLLLQAERIPDATRQFRELLRRDPKDADALYALGLLALQADHPKEARGYMTRLVELGVRTDAAHYYLGRIAEAEGHPQQAIAEYGQVRRGQLALDSQIRIARILAARGDVAQARKRLSELRRRVPALAVRLYLAEGEILRETDHYRQALAVYDRALERHPGNDDLLYGRALIAAHLGDLKRAERDLKTILARDPDNVEALNALGYTLADGTTRYHEALGYIRKALARKPDDPAILDSMGWVQFRLGHLPQALDYLRRALKLSGGDDEIAAHLGEVLWASGAHGEARKVWDRALRAHPDSSALRAVVRRFER